MSSHFISIFKDMPSGLKKVAFEQLFFDNNQLSKYVADYISQNKNKIAKKTVVPSASTATMTDNNLVSYDQAIQVEIDQKDQYVQHETLQKEQAIQIEIDSNDQFVQTDLISLPEQQNPIVSPPVVVEQLPLAKKTRATRAKSNTRPAARKRAAKKEPKDTSSDELVLETPPKKRRSIAIIDLPAKKKKADNVPPRISKPAATFSKRNGPAKKLK